MDNQSQSNENCDETESPAKKRGRVQPVALFKADTKGGSTVEGREMEREAAEAVAAGSELIKAYRQKMMTNSKAADCLVIDGIVKTTGGYVHDTAGAYDHDTADAFHRMELNETCRAPLADDALATRAKVPDADLGSARLDPEGYTEEAFDDLQWIAFHTMKETEDGQAPLAGDALATRAGVPGRGLGSVRSETEEVFEKCSRHESKKFKTLDKKAEAGAGICATTGEMKGGHSWGSECK